MKKVYITVILLLIFTSMRAYAADLLAFDCVYQDSLTSAQLSHAYTFTLPDSGCIQLHSTADLPWMYYYLYDESNQRIWSINPKCDTVTGRIAVNEAIDLTAGTYTLLLAADGSDTGWYTVQLHAVPAQESFPESAGHGNTPEQVPAIELNQTYTGQIAQNDDVDTHAFSLAHSGRITLHTTAHMEWLRYILYDESGQEIWSKNPQWNSSTGQISQSYSIDLVQGRYNLVVKKDGQHTGVYTIRLNFADAKETIAEAQGALRNTWELADTLKAGTTYRGQLAYNDLADYSRFSLSASCTVALQSTAEMEWLRYALYNGNEECQWTASKHWNAASHSISMKKTVILPAGTYYVTLLGDPSSTGTYTFRYSTTVLPTPKLVSAASTGYQSVKLTWKKDAAAQGYVLYRKSGTSGWKQIKTISSNSTVSYTDTGLTCGTSYTYTVRSRYSALTGTALSGYDSKGVRAAPKLQTPALKSQVYNSSRKVKLSWAKISGAYGYELYRSTKKSSGYKKIKTLSSGSYVSYMNTGLKQNTQYYYKLRAYRTVNSSKKYSSYSSVKLCKISK